MGTYLHTGHAGIVGILQTATSNDDKERQALLESFGATLADRPMDMERVSIIREKLRNVGGDALVVEAATMVGAFALMTCVVDATGRKPFPGMAEAFAKKFGHVQ